MGYRDEREALLERNRALEQEIARLRGEGALVETAADEAWVIDAHAQDRRRLLRRLLAGTAATMVVIFLPALWGGRPSDLALVSLPIWVGTLLWAGAAASRCPRCKERLSREVRAGRKRRCQACRAPVHPSSDD